MPTLSFVVDGITYEIMDESATPGLTGADVQVSKHKS
jgi:hypothetical protein